MRRVELVEDLASLRGEWVALCERDPTATPFVSFEWISTWCRHWSAGGVPWILATYDGDRLAGLAPFLLRRRGGLRFLSGLGSGVGNYWNIIAAPADREWVLAAVAGSLRERSSAWDAFFMDKLPQDSPTEAALRTAGLRLDRPIMRNALRIELPGSFEEYMARVSGRRRRQIRRSLEPLDTGELTLRTVSEPEDLRDTLALWQALKVEWWAMRGLQMDAEQGTERFLEFTQEVVAQMVSAGLAVVWELTSGDRVVAVNVALLDQGSFYGWLGGFDHRAEDQRPGHAIVAYGIRWSIETGLRYFDFMVGDEPYKHEYGPSDRALLTATIGNDRPKSRFVLGLSRLRHEWLPADLRIPLFGRSD